MRCLLFVSIMALAASCASAYKHAQRLPTQQNCVTTFKPQFTRALYSTQVDVVGKHLSGLLIIKTMPDSSVRMVFASEAGFKFFDFGFKGTDFTVYHIIEQMDKKAVIKTLRKDFELLLMQPLNKVQPYSMRLNNETYHVFADGKDHYYYITDSNCTSLTRMERGSKRKKVTEIHTTGTKNTIPDSVNIQHHNFNFTITLKQLQDHVEQ